MVNGRVYSTSRTAAAMRGSLRTKKTKKTLKLWWGLEDPEMKRRQRVAMYKLYDVEGKLKSSFKKGIRWIKRKCSRIVRGYY